MNTVIKMFFLTVSLCVASVYAGDKQVGEHKGSESPRSSLNALVGTFSSVQSVGPIESDNFQSTNGTIYGGNLGPAIAERLELGDEDCLTPEQQAYLRATAVDEPLIVFGAAPFPTTHTAVQKQSCLQCLSQLCGCCKK